MQSIALIGGGPAALFMYKRIVEARMADTEVHIFEKHDQLGAGMPYSKYGSAHEHITNVSDNEIPDIKTHINEWIERAPVDLLNEYNIDQRSFNEYKVLPRLFFGEYLTQQFEILIAEGSKNKIKTLIHLHTEVVDIIDDAKNNRVKVVTESEVYTFDHVVICTGHKWPCTNEKNIEGWFDSPYPPQKLSKQINYPVAIRGASLTAIDALRSLAHANGTFSKNEDGTYSYLLHKESDGFNIVLHSIGGLLPAMRFHLKDTHLTPAHMLSKDEITFLKHRNDGFIPLDHVYNINFRDVLKKEQPELYNRIKDMSIEGFIGYMMQKRRSREPFELLKYEYREAQNSIENHESVIWKETLGALSYAMNYPAKHFSAEDMLRLKNIMMPLISVIIAYMPQTSAREMMALHQAGVLEIVAVDSSSKVIPGENGGALYEYTDDSGQGVSSHYNMFVDAMGQKPFFYNDIPFDSLKDTEILSGAYLAFASDAEAEKEIERGNDLVVAQSSGGYILKLPGIQINDVFQPLNVYGVANPRMHIMAVPFIAGINPDYSGLDFCEASSQKIIDNILSKEPAGQALS